MIIKIAWKNMFRYKRRTMITAFAISAGVFFTILLNGLLAGMDDESCRNLLEYETAAAKIYANGYFDKREEYPTDILIEKDDSVAIEEFLNAQNISYTPSIVEPCEIYFTEDYFETNGSMQAVLWGLDPEKSKNVFGTPNNIEKGIWLARENGEAYTEGAVVGSWMVSDMKADIGYYITVQCKGKEGFSQTIDVPIVGIINCPNAKINMGVIFMDLAYLDDMLMMEGSVTEYDINLGGLNQVDKRYDLLNASFQDAFANQNNIELYSWRTIAEEILFLQSSVSSMSGILMFFIFILAAVGISNTMYMSIIERKNEIAMLKAMGYTPLYIKSLFMWEGVSIGLIGCITGIITGSLINIPLVNHGIDFSSLLSTVDMGYRVSGIIHSSWDWVGFVQVTIGALIIAGISAYIPTRSTLKLEIADIFRKN